MARTMPPTASPDHRLRRWSRRLAALATAGLAAASHAAAPVPASLVDEITRMDARLFDAFNACDVATMDRLFARDLEFVHDLGGVSGHDATMAATRRNCDRRLGLRRTLVPGSLRVYPVKDFGAIQVGEHTFCHVEDGRDDCGTFEFVHVWRRTADGWELARVISYGH